MLAEPFHYRDERTARGVELVHGRIGEVELYRAAGLQFLPFNTLYQLAVDHADGVLAQADGFVMIPDLLAFWLTGERAVERTNASTTGLVDVGTGEWNASLIAALGFPIAIFPPLVGAGTRVGATSPQTTARLGAARPIDVVAVGSHDTASAVVGVPMTGSNAAYISSGTWSLVGVELDRSGAHRPGPRGQLHQRGRGRRHDPLPAQRVRAVAADRVAARVGAAGRSPRPCRPARSRCTASAHPRSSTRTTTACSLRAT